MSFALCFIGLNVLYFMFQWTQCPLSLCFILLNVLYLYVFIGLNVKEKKTRKKKRERKHWRKRKKKKENWFCYPLGQEEDNTASKKGKKESLGLMIESSTDLLREGIGQWKVDTWHRYQRRERDLQVSLVPFLHCLSSPFFSFFSPFAFPLSLLLPLLLHKLHL